MSASGHMYITVSRRHLNMTYAYHGEKAYEYDRFDGRWHLNFKKRVVI
jgi:hypothetical protein